tara:strand:+ start:101 stop:676 length:576 start_codon:yes stop_codon:yes gene_type:complete
MLNEIKALALFFINFFPGKIGKALRRICFRVRLSHLGKNFNTEIGFSLSCPKNISIGDNFKSMRFVSLNACEKSTIKIGDNLSVSYNVNINSCQGEKIEIGDNVLIASNVVIRSANHNIYKKNELIKDSKHIPGKIKIGNDVWIGSNCVILSNVEIGNGAVIGAGSIISKNVSENAIVVSKQQIEIRSRFD